MIRRARSFTARIFEWSPPLRVRIALAIAALSFLGWLAFSVQNTGVDSWRLAALAVVVMITATAINGWKWGLLAKALMFDRDTPSMRTFVRVYFEGQTYSMVLPTAVGGDVYRTMYLARNSGSSMSTSVASVLLDRLTGLLGQSLLAAVGLVGGRVLGLSGFVVVPVGIGLIYATAAAGWLATTGIVRPRFSPARSRLLLASLAVGATYTIVWLAGIFILARALGIPLRPGDVGIIELIHNLGTALPLTFGGFGTREGSFVLGLGTLGYSLNQGFSLGIAFTGVMLIQALVGGSTIGLATARAAWSAASERRQTGRARSDRLTIPRDA
jgi:uncharacterized membrane protein YbhN (UPF0104 family)